MERWDQLTGATRDDLILRFQRVVSIYSGVQHELPAPYVLRLPLEPMPSPKSALRAVRELPRSASSGLAAMVRWDRLTGVRAPDAIGGMDDQEPRAPG